MAITIYNTGTASVSAGGTTVTGAGTIWTGGNAREGDEFVIDGVRALILDVVSATELTITPWQGGNESGAAYTIYQTSSRRFEDVQIADDLQKQVAALNTDGFYHFVKSSEAAPDPSLGDEGQYAFQATTGKLWLKEGGVWVYVGVFKGVSPKGPWDSATDYAANDLVSHGGSSYLAVAASTNDAPPSANWMLIAAKGEPGQDGTNGSDGAQGPIGPIGLVNAGVYNPATAYDPTDYVIDNGSTWVCVAATTGNAPPVLPVESNTWWSLLARKGQDGTGTGDMQAANNLSDLVDPDTALDNLGGTAVGKAVFTAADQAAARATVGALGVIRVQTFTSSGTYTPDINLIYAVVECVGGGGGGGAGVGATGSVFAGAGGGSGGYSRKYMDATTIGASQAVTIGAGGAGGVGDADGGAGGATSFGSACTANGGGGGKRSSTSVFPLQGAGASVGTGDFTAAGTAGGGGVYSSGALNPRFPSGEGAGSIFGGGAIGVNSSGTAGAANGVNASGYGGGGSGGGAYNTAVNQNGGNGSAGVVIITEFCSE